MKRKKSPKMAGRPDVPDGWWWVRYFVPLRGGHWHYEWLPARVEGGRVQLWGSSCTIPLTAPVLWNALWHGPIEPPPLDDPPRTALALHQGGSRQTRNNWSQEGVDFTDAERHAMKIHLLAGDITELLFEAGKEVRQGRVRLEELVDRVEELLDDAFGSRSDYS
jgi:hypothetical protein